MLERILGNLVGMRDFKALHHCIVSNRGTVVIKGVLLLFSCSVDILRYTAAGMADPASAICSSSLTFLFPLGVFSRNGYLFLIHCAPASWQLPPCGYQWDSKSQASKGTPSWRLPVKQALTLLGAIPLAAASKSITKAGWAVCWTSSTSVLSGTALAGPK